MPRTQIDDATALPRAVHVGSDSKECARLCAYRGLVTEFTTSSTRFGTHSLEKGQPPDNLSATASARASCEDCILQVSCPTRRGGVMRQGSFLPFSSGWTSHCSGSGAVWSCGLPVAVATVSPPDSIARSGGLMTHTGIGQRPGKCQVPLRLQRDCLVALPIRPYFTLWQLLPERHC